MQHFLPNGQVLIIRPAVTDDAPQLLSYFRQVVSETDFILMTPPEAATLTVADEAAFIRSLADDTHHLHLLALTAGKVVGAITVKQPDITKEAHLGQLGIAVLHEYWNMGIGRRLITAAMRWAEQHRDLEIIHLSVFSNNERAIQLYRNFGFLEYGRLLQGVRHLDGTYGDTILMSKKIRQ
jgi:RimJ/RimL family protein N-acetyltransferase